MSKKQPKLLKRFRKLPKRQVFGIISLFALLLGSMFFIAKSSEQNVPANAQLAQPGQAGKFVIFGIAYTGDGLAPGWKNGSLFNGVNTWNIIDKEQFYAGIHSLSWAPAAPFERGWIVSQNTPIQLNQYTYLNLYGRSTEPGQRLEIGFADMAGNLVGNFIPLESMGGPLVNDRWTLYSGQIAQFNANGGQIYGLVFRDSNGAPQKKIYFDEIELSGSPGTAPVISAGLGQPGTPTLPPKPKGPFYPQISPWVFIIPGMIILLAIFFE